MSPAIGGSRFGRNAEHERRATVWACPSCGKQQEGRRPEEGCGDCGAGVPREAPARAEGPEQTAAPTTPEVQPVSRYSAQAPLDPRTRDTREASQVVRPTAQAAGPLKIYRLIEYVFSDDEAMEACLRNALVGRWKAGRVSITGCIVDDLSPLQEDRLRMARMQPGVWTGKQIADEGRRSPAHVIYDRSHKSRELGRFDSCQGGRAPENPTGGGERRVAPSPGNLLQERESMTADLVEMTIVLQRLPDKFLRTLMGALTSVLQELPSPGDTADPDINNLLDQKEASDLIEWLENHLPQIEPPAEDLTPEEQARRQYIRDSIVTASTPGATFKGEAVRDADGRPTEMK